MLPQLNYIDYMFYLNRYKKNAGVGSFALFENKNDTDFKNSIIKNIIRNIDSSIIFTHKIQNSPIKNDYPYFVKDNNFNIQDHIFEYNKNEQYNKETVQKIFDDIVSKPLPLDKPLWDVHIIYNYDEKGNVGLFRRVHHSAADGEGMAKFFNDAVFDDVNLPKEKSYYKISKVKSKINHFIKVLNSKKIKLFSLIFTTNKSTVEKPLNREDLYQGLWRLKMSTNQSLLFKTIDISEYKEIMKKLNISNFHLCLYLTASVYKKIFNTVEENKTIITTVPCSLRRKKDKLYGNRLASARLNLHLNEPSNFVMLNKIKNSLKNELELVKSGPFNGYVRAACIDPRMSEMSKIWEFANQTTWNNRKKTPTKTENPIYVSTSTTYMKTQLPSLAINGNKIISLHGYSMVICTPGSIGCSATYRLFGDELQVILVYIKELFKDTEKIIQYYDEALLELKEMCND